MAVREYRWDNLKIIMIIGIVMEHTLLIYGYPRNIELLWASCISWLMPLFTVISGYWFKKRTIKDLCNKYLYPMLFFFCCKLHCWLFLLFTLSQRYSSDGLCDVVSLDIVCFCNNYSAFNLFCSFKMVNPM